LFEGDLGDPMVPFKAKCVWRSLSLSALIDKRFIFDNDTIIRDPKIHASCIHEI